MKMQLTIHTNFPLSDEQAAAAIQMLQAILDNNAKRKHDYEDRLEKLGVLVTISGSGDTNAECYLSKLQEVQDEISPN
jgi:hypothetical protein